MPAPHAPQTAFSYIYHGGGDGRSTPPFSIPRRCPPYFCLTFLRAGTLRSFTDTEDSLAHAGDLVINPPHIPHSHELIGDTTIECTSLHISWSYLEVIDLGSFYEFPTVVHGRLARTVCRHMRALNRSAPLRDPPHNEILAMARCDHDAYGLLASLLETGVQTAAVGEASSRLFRLHDAFASIRHHIASPFTFEDLAASVKMSPSRFYTVFQEATGQTPMGYVRALRLQHAQEMLLRTRLPIGAIGQQIDYPSPYVFSRFFKNACGISPSTFRAQQGLGP